MSVAAWLWRRLLFRTTFVAVTGSLGKTTAKEMLAAALSSRAPTFKSVGNQNSGVMIPLNVLRVRPWSRYAVIEVGVGRPGAMLRAARLLKPNVAVILRVARTHTKGFKNLEECAAEKAVLLEWLAPGGVAVLNGDDPRVAAMRVPAHARRWLFGSSDAFDVRISQAECRWPDRLRFRVSSGAETCVVQTRQLGRHWVSSLAAALAAARSLGVSLRDAAGPLSRVPPYPARMEPVALPGGAVVIRDDYNGAIDTLEAALRFLSEARATRRVLVISDVTDSGQNRRVRLDSLAAAVAPWLDLLVLIGADHRYECRRLARSGMAPERIVGCQDLHEAVAYLRAQLKAGDLALVKGRVSHHLARILFALTGTIACWKVPCPKTMLCDGCWELGFRPQGEFEIASLGRRA